jgi:glycosyltransferase involved in cell wall biosynthesis
MNRLGFVVGRPTQFESPFYQYITQNWGSDSICVYYYKQADLTFKDSELGNEVVNSWGIDLLSNYSWKLASTNTLKEVFCILKENKYIIVNGYTYSMAVWILIFGKIFGKKIGLRLDTVLWNQSSLIKKIYKKILLQSLNLFVDVFWVTGLKSKEYLMYFGISKDKIKILSYVVNVEWFAQKSKLNKIEKKNILNRLLISNENTVITCVTKLVQRESPLDLIHAFHKLGLKNSSLLIIGDGEDRSELENYVKNELCNSNVIFHGYANYIDLPTYYAISDIFVHTSINEPWGVSVQEAMACDLPVIASNFVGSAYDLIREGENGFIYKSGQVDDLCDKIKRVLNIDKNKIITVNNTILKNWTYKYTWNEVSNHIDNIT